MGLRNWMIVGTDGDAREILKSKPPLDRAATAALAARLFPGKALEPLADRNLGYTSPPENEVVAGVFPGLTVIAAFELGLDRPSTLPAPFRDPSLGRTIYLHAMHSVVDWFAFAIWRDGKLVRSLSLSAEGIFEDIGERLPFELPYWEGRHPALEPDEDPGCYPFAFHPLELGEAALQSFFGYHFDVDREDLEVDLGAIPLLTFQRGGKNPASTAPAAAAPASPGQKRWWKFW